MMAIAQSIHERSTLDANYSNIRAELAYQKYFDKNILPTIRDKSLQDVVIGKLDNMLKEISQLEPLYTKYHELWGGKYNRLKTDITKYRDKQSKLELQG